MKDFFTVLRFEFVSFIKNKTFIISTLIICLVTVIGLSVPTMKNTFSTLLKQESKADTEQEIKKYGIIDHNNVIDHLEGLDPEFIDGRLVVLTDITDLEAQIDSGNLMAGYIIKSPTSYEYVVQNNELFDRNLYALEEVLINAFRTQEFKEMGIDYTQVEGLLNPEIEIETKILGKDSASNYFYTYGLIMILYMMIILYGQLIATSVASEKSNRTMEVLITSTKSTNLIFGKVLGVAMAGILQTGLIITTSLTAYQLNIKAWESRLDFVFNIPRDVMFAFIAFGILGYLFYAFIFGALGALVSRTEDVSASATPIMFLFIGTFIVSMIGMQDTSGLLLKVASFVPFSSFMAMFVRVAMGSVSNLEVMISLVILALTTGLIGLLAAKIYRAGTLMYGNRVKLKDLWKILKSE